MDVPSNATPKLVSFGTQFKGCYFGYTQLVFLDRPYFSNVRIRGYLVIYKHECLVFRYPILTNNNFFVSVDNEVTTIIILAFVALHDFIL